MTTGTVRCRSRMGAAMVATAVIGCVLFLAPPQGQAETLTHPAPIVTSVDPTSGYLGQDVVVHGSNFFTGYTGVVFDNLLAPIFPQTINDAGTTITFPVPDIGVGPHTLFVTTDGQASPRFDFTVLPQPPAPPHIDAIVPTAGTRGDSITIFGSHFTGGSVHLGGQTLDVAVSSDTYLLTGVPLVAPFGPTTLTVVSPDGTSNAVPFTVTYPATLTSSSPTATTAGSVVDVLGSGFVPGGTTFDLGGTSIPAGAVTVNLAGTIATFTVPFKALPAAASLTAQVDGAEDGVSNAIPFTVMAPSAPVVVGSFVFDGGGTNPVLSGAPDRSTVDVAGRSDASVDLGGGTFTAHLALPADPIIVVPGNWVSGVLLGQTGGGTGTIDPATGMVHYHAEMTLSLADTTQFPYPYPYTMALDFVGGYDAETHTVTVTAPLVVPAFPNCAPAVFCPFPGWATGFDEAFYSTIGHATLTFTNVSVVGGTTTTTTVPTGPPATGSPIPTVPATSTTTTTTEGSTTTTVAPTEAPVLDSLSPTSGPAGTEITLTGSTLEGAELHVGNEVVPLALDTRISTTGHATVPADLTPGPATVFLANSIGESAHETFTVTPPDAAVVTTETITPGGIPDLVVHLPNNAAGGSSSGSGSGSGLARTGINAGALAALGAIVLLTGLALTATSRRRARLS